MDNESQASPLITIIAFIVVIIMIAGGAALLLSARPEPVQITINPPLPTATDAPAATPAPILVYITGAVENPEQTLTIAHNSRVSDVIEAAGGLTDDADIERVNMAGIVRDGDQIHVPAIQETTTADASSNDDTALPTPSGGGIVFINSATLEELQTLPGIGPSTAEDIITYRDENGAFTSLEDLDDVPGIGPSTLEGLEDLISFE